MWRACALAAAAALASADMYPQGSAASQDWLPPCKVWSVGAGNVPGSYTRLHRCAASNPLQRGHVRGCLRGRVDRARLMGDRCARTSAAPAGQPIPLYGRVDRHSQRADLPRERLRALRGHGHGAHGALARAERDDRPRRQPAPRAARPSRDGRPARRSRHLVAIGR